MKKLGIILLGLIIISCQDLENCDTISETSFLFVELFDATDSTERKLLYGYRSANEIIFQPDTTIEGTDTTIWKAGDTLILGNTGIILSQSPIVSLPLSIADNSSIFSFQTDTMDYSLSVSYQKEVSIFDPSCEPAVTLKNLNVLSHSFDSLSILNNQTNLLLGVNFEVYF